jgi:hypothetical protein
MWGFKAFVGFYWAGFLLPTLNTTIQYGLRSTTCLYSKNVASDDNGKIFQT